MNCPRCNSPLQPNAKFCTHCGQKIALGSVCPHCGQPIRESAKFCPLCGQPAAAPASQPPVKDCIAQMANTSQRIYWDLQPGQVARVITEAEFATCEKFRGVIIAEGTTAYIRANGKTLGWISGGCYDFPETPSKSFFGRLFVSIGKGIKRSWELICGLFASSQAVQPPTEKERLKEQQALINQYAQEGADFSIVILLDKAFPIYIGGKQSEPDDYEHFVPMQIKTKHVTTEVGVNAYLRIANKERFILHYLLDTNQLNTTLIVHEISDLVRAAVEYVLGDMEIDDRPIPASVSNMIKQYLNESSGNDLIGLEVVRIVEISVGNESLNKLAQLSEELYISEKMLDAQRRTHDFMNRLADEENSQLLHEATTEAEFEKAFEKINYDHLLSQDEAERFRVVLYNERIVHDAQSKDERESALAKIVQQGMLRESELQQLREQQSQVLEMIRLGNQIEFEQKRLEGNNTVALQTVKAALERQGLVDDYAYTQTKRQLDLQYEEDRRQRDLDYEDERRHRELNREDDNEQFKQFMALQQADEQSRENQRHHEEEMERMKWEHAAHMSEEQILATGGGEAAVELAKAQQNKYSVEAERAANARVENLQNQQTEFMRNMVSDMMKMNSNIQRNEAEHREERLRDKIAVQEERLQENNDRMRRQEGRLDEAYDRALNYTTRETAGSNRFCPNCGAQVAAKETFCSECGTKI